MLISEAEFCVLLGKGKSLKVFKSGRNFPDCAPSFLSRFISPSPSSTLYSPSVHELGCCQFPEGPASSSLYMLFFLDILPYFLSPKQVSLASTWMSLPLASLTLITLQVYAHFPVFLCIPGSHHSTYQSSL